MQLYLTNYALKNQKIFSFQNFFRLVGRKNHHSTHSSSIYIYYTMHQRLSAAEGNKQCSEDVPYNSRRKSEWQALEVITVIFQYWFRRLCYSSL